MCHFYVLLFVGLFFSVACDSGKKYGTRSRAQTDMRVVQDFPVVQGPPRLAVEVPGNHDRRVWLVMAIRDEGPGKKQVYAFLGMEAQQITHGGSSLLWQ